MKRNENKVSAFRLSILGGVLAFVELTRHVQFAS